jgi:hypothetical protein
MSEGVGRNVAHVFTQGRRRLQGPPRLDRRDAGDRQRQCRVALLLTDRRQDTNPAILHLQDSLRRITIVVADLDAVKTFDLHVIHFIGDRVIAVSGQAIDAGSHEEVRSDLLRCAKEFVDVAFAVADMNAPFRLSEQFRSLLQVLQPADTLLLLDRHPRRIDLLFESGGPFELFPGPELDGDDLGGCIPAPAPRPTVNLPRSQVRILPRSECPVASSNA